MALGRLDDALEAITEGLDAVRSNDYPQAICLTLRGHARVLRWLGRTADAVAAVEEALVVTRASPKVSSPMRTRSGRRPSSCLMRGRPSVPSS